MGPAKRASNPECTEWSQALLDSYVAWNKASVRPLLPSPLGYHHRGGHVPVMA